VRTTRLLIAASNRSNQTCRPLKSSKSDDNRLKSRVLYGAYTAAFFTSAENPTIFHAIITKHGSREIIAWIQSRSQDDCDQQAAQALRGLNGGKSENLLLFPKLPPRLQALKAKKVRKKRA